MLTDVHGRNMFISAVAGRVSDIILFQTFYKRVILYTKPILIIFTFACLIRNFIEHIFLH
jgi:hypothetical protein